MGRLRRNRHGWKYPVTDIWARSVTPGGRDDPASCGFVPAQFSYSGLEACVVIKPVMFCDTLRMLLAYKRGGQFMRRLLRLLGRQLNHRRGYCVRKLVPNPRR